MTANKPIKVVHIITRLILGGAQEDTLLLVEGLKSYPEYDVTLISGPALGPEGELISRARQNNVDLIILPEMQRNIHPLKDFIAFIKLLRLLRKLQPTIVHTHSSKAGILGRLAARLVGVPKIVHTIYGLPFHPFQSRLVNWLYIFLERLCARYTDKLISIAGAMTHQALSAGVGKPEQFQTIRSGIELAKFLDIPDKSPQLRKLYGIKENEKVIGVIARLAPLKGHQYLMEIASRIIQQFPQTKFLFVGDGVLKEKIISEAGQKGVLEKIIFTGQVNLALVPHLIRLADIVVHPSLREGLARALPESYLMKKPVIAFALDGAGEVIRNKETGYLIAPCDTEQFYGAIIELLSDQIKAQQMGLKGHYLVMEQFNHHRLSAEVSRLYHNLLEIQG